MTGSDVPASMPERIGRYELLFPIGTGGMGTVYLGRAEVLPGVQRFVAVKLMHSELRANPEIGPQLMREARLAASIQHPNVVKVIEAGDSPHGVFLIMDHIEGDTLAGIIRAARKRDEPVPLPIAGKILRDALTGLHAAHELKGEDGRPLDLVHRDFSPHNILVGVDGNSHLTDFGIAKALTHANATATGIIKGKVGYMAPEQARGERIDRRSDVWAAGVVAWEVLTSRRLFRAANDAATLLQVVSGKRPPLVSSARRDVPDRIDEAVAAALEPRPNRRTATALALRKQIEEALGAIGGVADADEVAEYVKELVGDRIEHNRERAASVLELRAQLATISESAQEEASSDASTLGTPPQASEFREVSGTRGALTVVSGEQPTGKRSRRWLWGVAGALLASGGVLAATTLREPIETTPVASTTASSAPLDAASTASAAHSGAVQSSSASSSAEAAPARRVLVLVANEPIAQLKVDSRTIVLPDAAREVEVPMGETPPRRVVALTQDGRRMVVELAAGQRRAELTFPKAAPPPAPGWLPPTPPPQPAGDGLAESPYGAK